MSSTIPGRLCADDPHALAEVERAIASGALTLLFTDELEQRFQADTLAQRRKFLNLVGISGMVVYNFGCSATG